MDNTSKLNEIQFEEALLDVIRSFRDKKLTEEEFSKEAKALANRAIPQQIKDFTDHDLGWAKTWVDEISYYGIDEVMNNKFNFFSFLEKQVAKNLQSPERV